MALVTPYNVRLNHLIGRDGMGRSSGSKIAPPGTIGAPEVDSVLSPDGSTDTLVSGRNFVSLTGFETTFEFTDVSGSTLLTSDQIAAAGTFNDSIALIDETLLPDRVQTGLVLTANGQAVTFVIV